MNLLQIALTTKCNFKCKTCPMAEYRTTEHPKYGITNIRLIPYLYKYIDPNKWFIELTGGEPATYEGLEELLLWLTNHQYRGLIKTNGSLPIGKWGHFPRIAAFHDLNNPPKYYDKVLLIQGLETSKKAQYCREHNIPFEIIGFNKDIIDNVHHNIERVSFINAVGQVLRCPSCKPNPTMGQYGDLTTVDFSKPIDHIACQHCKAIIDFWKFIDDDWKAMCDKHLTQKD